MNGSDLQQVDLEDGHVKEIVPPKAWWISLSPDEKDAAYTYWNGSGLELVLHDLATMAERAAELEVTGEGVQAGDIIWSPDA